MAIDIATIKRRNKRSRIPIDQRKKMDLIFNGALAVIAKHKALAAAKAPATPIKLRIQPRKRPA